MTTLPLHPTAPLTPAQQLALATVVSDVMDHLGGRLLRQHPDLVNARVDVLTDLERLDLLKRHGQAFVTLNRDAFLAAFDAYCADMVAQGAGGCL